MKLIKFIIELICWVNIFVCPAAILSFIGFAVYYNYKGNLGLTTFITLSLLGAGLGIYFAEKIRRTVSCTMFLTRTNWSEKKERRKNNLSNKTIKILIVMLLFAYCSFGQSSGDVNSNCLNKVNSFRISIGLDPVVLSDSLSKSCLKHAKYLVINRHNSLTEGLLAHKEFKELERYSEDGEIAGSSSVIHFIEPVKAIDGWIKTFYHRIPFMQPNLKEIGIGYCDDTANAYEVSLLHCVAKAEFITDTDRFVVYYPAPYQKGIPTLMGGEIPDPVPDNYRMQSSVGFPITIFFANYQAIKNVQFTLRDNDNIEKACFVSSPEKPATFFDQWNTICAIPKEELKYSTKYYVTVSCTVNEIPFNKSYYFITTAEE